MDRRAAASSRLAKLEALVRNNRVLLRRLGIGLSILIIAISAFIFARTIISIDPAQLEAAFAATGARQITLAFALSALSYLALAGYDGLALLHLRERVPLRITALASFTSYAISFTLGFPLIPDLNLGCGVDVGMDDRVHLTVPLDASILAVTLSARTASVIINAPVQASCCHSL